MADQFIHAVDNQVDRPGIGRDHQIPRDNCAGTLHTIPEISPEQDRRHIQHFCAAELGNSTGIQLHSIEVCNDQITCQEQFVIIVANRSGICLCGLKILRQQQDLITSGGKPFDLFSKQHVTCQFFVIKKATGEINFFCHTFTFGSFARLFAISSSVGI